jgi:hypothetical protein
VGSCWTRTPTVRTTHTSLHVAAVGDRIINRPPLSDLVEWRLRLFCGHVVTRTSHHTNTTVHMDFTGTVACPECGLDPSTIVSAEALRRLFPERQPLERDRDDTSIRRAIARHEREIEKLRAQLGES